MSLFARRSNTVLMLAVLTAVGAMLAICGQAAARTRGVACSASAGTRVKRGAHACGHSGHHGKAHPKSKHHSKHAATKPAGKAKRAKAHHTRRPTRKAKRKAPPALIKARCENGAAPVHAATDFFVCVDGSEPYCENGSYPIVSRNGANLMCNGATAKRSAPGAPPTSGAGSKPGGGSSSGPSRTEAEEAICEDGSSPFPQHGSFVCDDESEPYCEEGAYPAPSSDGQTLMCDAESAEE
jgi:hypothetical protein